MVAISLSRILELTLGFVLVDVGKERGSGRRTEASGGGGGDLMREFPPAESHDWLEKGR